MEFLKTQFSRVQEQFSHLTASQKMLAMALVVITVMTLYWWTTFAGKADMEVLFDQPMATDQIASAIAQLRASGIDCQAVGDRLHVAADKKLEAIGLLSSSMLLPSDTKNAIDELVGKINPWMSHSLEDRMFLHAKQTVLAQTLRYWPQVRHAVVIIDPTRDRGPGGAEPSASVSVMLKPGAAADQRLADSIGDFISGTLSSLHRSRVKVHINDRSFTLRDKDDRSVAASAEDLLAQMQSYEKHYADNIKKAFGYMDGVFVTVSCRVNNERTEKVVETIDPKGVVAKPVRESSFTEENNSNKRDSGEPGVVSNQALSVDTTSSGEKNSGTSEKTETEYAVAMPRSSVKTLNNGGDSTPTGVSVLFPRSRFVQEYKQIKNSEKEPDPTILQAFIDEQLRVKRAIVKGCVGTLADEAVTVADYADSLPITGGATLAAATPISLMFTDHAKEIALGALALVSLFMVSNMVRKGSATPAPAIAMAGVGMAPRGTAPLQGREEAVGEAVEGDPLLDGMELDEESAKAQQMLNQVSELVEENPDAAANLVKRWMNRS
jgi:flagellar biosynthesis/type III secretory pathway M-ring protein FliF/YscJ